MDTSCKKMYGLDEFDTRTLLETYFSLHSPYSIVKETTLNMIQLLYKAFTTGLINGRTLIDLSLGPIIAHLLAIKDFVQEITILEVNEAGLKELEDWKNKNPDGFDWSHVAKILKEFKGNSDESDDEEENLRKKIVNILKCDFNKDYPAGSLPLPRADIVTSIWGLDVICRDHEDYRRHLRKLSNLINLGGYLIIYGDVNASYFTVGEHKYHVFTCDRSFYPKILSEEGFEIKHFESFGRLMHVKCVDHEEIVFIIAQKLKEP
ncbi:hypothetical protein PRIEUP_LOCUS1370 [Pristimantis euphronides]